MRRAVGTAVAATAGAYAMSSSMNSRATSQDTSEMDSVTPKEKEVSRGEAAKNDAMAILMPSAGPKAADAIIAGMGLFGSISALGILQSFTGRSLFAPPMMASGIIFFAGATPPSPDGFLSGTLCSATVSLGALVALQPRFSPTFAQGAAAGALLCWYKATGAIYPPAAVLAGLLASASVSATGAYTSLATTMRFLAFPWLAGHAWLYACAHATSLVRCQARIAMTKRALTSLGDEQSDDALQAIFTQFDTSGDGALDADELKIALRVALGVDISRDDCEKVILAADKDGTNTVDFGEFMLICRQRL